MMAARYAQQQITAAQNNADISSSVGVVTSLEMATAMARLARQVVQANQLSDVITVHEQHSCEMPPLSSKAMLCTSELLESGLLGEGTLWCRHNDTRLAFSLEEATEDSPHGDDTVFYPPADH